MNVEYRMNFNIRYSTFDIISPMSLPYFYEPTVPSSGTHFTLSEDSSKHCIQVLRMKTGELLQLTNGKGLLYTASIVSEDKKKTVVLLQQPVHTQPPVKNIHLAIALVKNTSRFEWLLEKATEIGVSVIQPLITKRTEHTRFRSDRMNSIVIAAMLQSQQSWLPVLHEPVGFEEIMSQPPLAQQLIAYCGEGHKYLIKELPFSSETRMLIGPEGDFTEDEFRHALQNKYTAVGLGETRLRTETAGIVAVSLLMNK